MNKFENPVNLDLGIMLKMFIRIGSLVNLQNHSYQMRMLQENTITGAY